MLKRSAAIAVLCLWSAGVAAQQAGERLVDAAEDGLGRSRSAGHLAEHRHGRRAVRAAGELGTRTEADGRGVRRSGRSRPSSGADADTETVVSTAAAHGRRHRPAVALARAGQASRQASLIVEPADGRLPPMTPEGQRRAATAEEHLRDVHAASTTRPSSVRTIAASRAACSDRCSRSSTTTATRSSRARLRRASATR